METLLGGLLTAPYPQIKIEINQSKSCLPSEDTPPEAELRLEAVNLSSISAASANPIVSTMIWSRFKGGRCWDT